MYTLLRRAGSVFRLTGALAGLAFLATAGSAQGATIFADTVIEYFNSGANPAFPAPQVYGGNFFTSTFPVLVPLTNAIDEDPDTFVSLPTGSFLTLGFSTGFISDAPSQNDIFISEPGAGFEDANVFVSSDFGATFTFLGVAFGNTLTELDLADISFAAAVNAIKVVGLDNGGGSPGFDLAFIQGLEGSVTISPIQPIQIIIQIPRDIESILHHPRQTTKPRNVGSDDGRLCTRRNRHADRSNADQNNQRE